MSTKTRSNAMDAFTAILEAALVDIPILRDLPAPVPSVVLTLVSGVSRSGAIGLQESETQRALEEGYRIQIDCYHNSKVECDTLADAVEQAIVDHEEALNSTYGIENIHKMDDADVARANELSNERRVRMDFGFTTYRAVA